LVKAASIMFVVVVVGIDELSDGNGNGKYGRYALG